MSQQILSVAGVEESLLVGSGKESQFNQASRHGSLSEHQKSGLVHTFVLPSGERTSLMLNHFSQFHTVRHIVVLHQFEHDIAFGRFRVKSGIALFVVVLHQDDRVFPFCHIQIIACPMHTQRIRFEAARYLSVGQRIGMDGDEEVGLVSVGDSSPLTQFDEDIRLACVNHFHIRTISFHIFTEGQCHFEVHVLFQSLDAACARIFAAMSCINDKCKAGCSHHNGSAQAPSPHYHPYSFYHKLILVSVSILSDNHLH